jgi:hypothetical protein
MYGLNRSIDLSFLRNRELIQVAIGLHQVIFAFDDDVTISVEGQFEHVSPMGSTEWRPGASELAANAVKLLGATVKSVVGQENGTLELAFSNGNCLIVRDVSSDYESYQITRRGQTIIV